MLSADVAAFISDTYPSTLPRAERHLVAEQVVAENVRALVADAGMRGDSIFTESSDVTAGYSLVNVYRNPWTELDEAFVYLLWLGEAALGARHPGSMVAGVQEYAAARGCRLVRMEVPESYAGSDWFAALTAAGWSTSGLIPSAMVDAMARQRGPSLPAGVAIRRAARGDRAYAVAGLLESIRKGLSDFELASTDQEKLRANVEREFLSALEEDRAFSFVAALDDGTLCAHGTAERSEHAVLGTREVLLHDILVRPGLSGRGIGDALEHAIFEECRRQQVCVVRGTLSFEHVPEERLRGVSARIVETGWWFSSRMVYRPLPEAGERC